VYGTDARRSTVSKSPFVVTDPANWLQDYQLCKRNHTDFFDREQCDKELQRSEESVRQGKEYYDKLKAINNLVKDARKVQQTVLLVGDVSEMYVQNSAK
jgi:hypothetical protein